MLSIIFLSLGAFVLALLAVVVIVALVIAARRWPGRIFQCQMFLVLIASVASVVLSNHILSGAAEAPIAVHDADIERHPAAKLLLMVVIGYSFAMCIAWIAERSELRRNAGRFQLRHLKPPHDIIFAFMFFYVAFSIFPIFFGQKLYFHVSLLYPFVVFLALFLWFQRSSVDPVIIAKQCLFILVAGSICAAALYPKIALETSYIGLIPGFNLRLSGVTATPNTLGSVAATLILLECAEPAQRRWHRCIALVLSALALLMTQSKTSISAALLGVFIIYGWRFVVGNQSRARSGGTGNVLLASAMLVTMVASISIVGIWLALSDSALLNSFAHKFETRAVDDLASASGRTLIWQLAIQSGLENPLFGQGGDFWNLDNRIRYGLSGAVHAHNLFLQAFSRSGLVGLTALLAFTYLLIRYSIRASVVTRGGSIALLAILLWRAIFEVPIQPNSILAGEFFAMMACFLYAIDRGAKPVQGMMNDWSGSAVFMNGVQPK